MYQFWDGRANRFFNGVNPFGSLDPDAKIWVNDGSGLSQERILIDFASLASQAVGPPNNATEMACGPVNGSRTWVDLARKLLSNKTVPLGLQEVHPDDGVLGPYHSSTGGINPSYAELVRDAFQDRYWKSDEATPGGATLMEANFAFIFGLAVQAYERTLLSDDSKFDRFARGEVDLTDQEKEGFSRFLSGGTRCNGCHDGPLFSTATFEFGLVFPIQAMDLENAEGPGLYDAGFYNVGVSPTDFDLGRGRKDLPFGDLLSLSKQSNAGTRAFSPNLPLVPASEGQAQVDGHMKSSGLRNIELTAPYFHNGKFATLEATVEFYARGGDLPGNRHLDPDIRRIGQLDGKPDKIAAVAAWMRTLTDDRVRFRRAPFDHPSILIPNGHKTKNGRVVDNLELMEATGKNGAATAFPDFLTRLGGGTTAPPADTELADGMEAEEAGAE